MLSTTYATAHRTLQERNMLPTPKFHHLHLNSINPDAAIDFYARQFASTSKTTWGGMSALQSPNDALLLFAKVDVPPAIVPQTAIWHFGWYVTDVRKNLEIYKTRPDVKLLPLYTTDEGGSVLINSDTWPNTGGVLGLTKAQIAEARANGVKPNGGPGFAYMQGPEQALVEYMGNFSEERFNHVHMYQEDPFCAQLWYQKHLNASVMPGRGTPSPMTEADCKVPRGGDRTWPALNREGMFRTPRAAVLFGDVALTWYAQQGDQPLVDTRGQLYDHIALSVADLDAWIAKLKDEGVTFLDGPYKLGATRAVMIEGPSREALELVEVR
jgi:catechol 2,3-dioxygenase-like lactoylglutathione lyase family enzyme